MASDDLGASVLAAARVTVGGSGMLGLIPFPYRIGIAAALVGILCLSSYVAGRKAMHWQMDALRQSYEVAAAQAAGREVERVRQAKARIETVEAKAVQHEKVRERNFNDSLDRVRHAYSSTRGLRLAPGSAALCPADSIGTKAELLREAETLIGAIRDADKDRAGLTGSIEAWPR